MKRVRRILSVVVLYALLISLFHTVASAEETSYAEGFVTVSDGNNIKDISCLYQRARENTPTSDTECQVVG